MLFDICNLSSSLSSASEICNLDFINTVSSAVAIIFSGIAIAYVASTYKTIWTHLFAFHNLRSALVLVLLLINICEIAETCLSINPPTGYFVSPIALISVCLALIGTVVVACYVRVIEIRDRSDWLSIAVFVELFQFVTKILKWKRLTKDMNVTNLQPFLTLCSSVLLCLLLLVDSLAMYVESRPCRKQKSTTSSSNENISYKHPKSTFYSKITFWWLTPLLWRGYWLPLELEDLGNLNEKDTSRYQYDQFLFIYQSFKNKQASLWLCYFKSCWKMFAIGGLLKFFGDLTGLVGPLSISFIVEYIERKTNKTNLTNENITVSNFINAGIPTTPDNDNIIYDTSSDYFDENNKIYFPNWMDFISNGWIICVLVLIASLAQGTFSQASTHLVNLEGIRLKNALQGLVYRKTLSLNLNNNSNNGNSSSTKSNCNNRRSSNNSNGHKNSNNKNDQQHNVIVNGKQQIEGNEEKTSPSPLLQQQKQQSNVQQSKYFNEDDGNNDEMQMQDAGTITNLMSEDTFNVMSFFWIAHYVWAIPLKVGVVMYLLYLKLGVSAIYGSFICILVMTPLQFLIGKAMSSNLKNASEYTDERLKKINEILLGIKLIKLNAWEKVFKEKINECRRKELKYLDLDSLFWTLMTFLAHVSTILVTFVTFAIFTNIEADTIAFTASRVFTSLALFNQLTVPLFIFPITVPIIIQAVVSTKRLENFLKQIEVQKDFEGIRNMARILCKSDASLDVYENENTTPTQPTIMEMGKEKGNEPTTLTDSRFYINLNKDVINDGEQHSELEKLQLKVDAKEMASVVTTTIPSKIDSISEMDDRKGSAAVPKTMKQCPPKNIKLKKSSQLKANVKLEKLRSYQPVVIASKDIQLPALGDDAVVCVQDGVFTWTKMDWENELKINKLQIPRGKLTVVVGKNGSGKSSLLAALLKEMHNVSGDVIWNKFSTIAYVTQTPWMMNTTIRENILFGESYRPKRYEKVLEACALKPDLELMPSGDMTEIGGNGINLSGGQKQRIAVARAVYSSGNVVILDDPFSSLDNEVGNYVFENCINKMLLKQKRTTILVTQKLQLVFRADKIIAMENNAIKASGVLADVESSNPELIQEWNSIISKENAKDMLLSSGRTARERWKLFKNISRLGLQRANTTEEDHLSSMQPVFKPSKRSSGFFGTHYLTHDLQLPIDECYNEDFEIRRRRSKRHRQCTSLEIRDTQKNVFRVNSLQLQERAGPPAKTPVARYVSSPTNFVLKKEMKSALKDDTDNLSGSSRISFRKFLRQMSSRKPRPSSVGTVAEICRDKQKMHTRNSITSIDEENYTHAPVKRLISSVSKYSEETEDEVCSIYNEEVSNRLIYDEERKYGKIPTRIYLLYLKSCGFYTVTIFFLSAFGWQALRVYTDIWLRDWTDINIDNDSEMVSYYFKIYGILSGLCILLAMISTPAGQIAGSNARNLLHNQLIDSILKNSMHYFQTVPLGRIMNRFSTDMTVIDKKVAATSQRLLQFLLLCLCAVLINTAITPWFIILTIPICAIYYVVQTFFRNSSREIQRIESITNSPIISHFSETIQGVTTIRAFNQESRFMEMLFKRMEANNVAFTIMNCSNRWLGIALDYLGAFIVFIAIVTALCTAHIYPEKTASSLVGLAINYTLLVPIYLNWVVKLLADMEMYIGAVERVQYYIESDNHENDVVCKSVPISWPQKGDIVFENVSLKYEEQKQCVISNLSLKIPAGQRIGICGRTGSGKSSLALSLFRVLNITNGRIMIDDVDIATINLDELRSRLSVIPQDVILFSGTVRENLDPRHHFTDLELWNCLETAQLKEIIIAQPNGLDTDIVEGGSNFSAGQRQLFCLARAVLRGSVCLILDEATSSLDTQTEKALLAAANDAFQGRTVITIAHRLSTILNYDRVIILENGAIVEDGNPRKLQKNTSSKFHEMLMASTNNNYSNTTTRD